VPPGGFAQSQSWHAAACHHVPPSRFADDDPWRGWPARPPASCSPTTRPGRGPARHDARSRRQTGCRCARRTTSQAATRPAAAVRAPRQPFSPRPAKVASYRSVGWFGCVIACLTDILHTIFFTKEFQSRITDIVFRPNTPAS
jgi:hypothetical protein